MASSREGTPIPTYARLGLSIPMANEFAVVFDTFLRDYAKLWRRQDVKLAPYNAARGQEEHIVECLYLPDYEMVQSQLMPVSTDSSSRISPKDMRDKEFVSGLRFYAASARAWYGDEEPIVFYRVYNSSKVLGYSLFGAFWDDGQVYDRLDRSAFLFDKNVDCVQAGHHLFIFNKYNFHVMFRVEELVRDVAMAALERIRKRIRISNFEEFVRDCQKPLSKLLKLRNIGQRPYLDQLTIDDLERTIRAKRLPIKVETTTDGERAIQYEPNDKWTLIKLLDDDFLWSDMTKSEYDAHSKSPWTPGSKAKRNA